GAIEQLVDAQDLLERSTGPRGRWWQDENRRNEMNRLGFRFLRLFEPAGRRTQEGYREYLRELAYNDPELAALRIQQGQVADLEDVLWASGIELNNEQRQQALNYLRA